MSHEDHVTEKWKNALKAKLLDLSVLCPLDQSCIMSHISSNKETQLVDVIRIISFLRLITPGTNNVCSTNYKILVVFVCYSPCSEAAFFTEFKFLKAKTFFLNYTATLFLGYIKKSFFMNMNVFLLEHLVYVCVFIYVRISVCACACMLVTLSNCVYSCVSIHVMFKSIGVRASFMCLS